MKIPLLLLLPLMLAIHSAAFEPSKKIEARNIVVSISGEVKIKGTMIIAKETTFSELLSKAKCYESGRTFVVARRVKEGAILKLKLKPKTKKNDKRKIFHLKDGDRIFVGDGLFAPTPEDQKVVKSPKKIPKVFVIRE